TPGAWPDLSSDSETGGKLFGALLSAAITKLQRSADQLITVTHGFAQTLQQRNMPPVEVISNSRAIEQLALLEARTRQAGELHVLYLGNHGESQQLDLLIEAARIARSENPHITVSFAGEGTQKPNLQAINAQAGNPVEMLPASFGDQTLEHYRWADTCMVTLRSDWASFAHTVPSKTYELLSYGKHITGVVCGEAAAILQQAGEHEIVAPDPVVVAQAWLRLAADPQSTPTQHCGRTWVSEHASDTTQVEKLDSVLKRNLPE